MEKPRMITAPVMLRGINYLLWSRTMKTTLCSHGLWRHVSTKEAPCLAIEGTQEGSEEQSKELAKWFQEDQLVLSILQSSLENSLLEAYSYCETACELWEILQKVYGNTSNLLSVEMKKRRRREEEKMVAL